MEEQVNIPALLAISNGTTWFNISNGIWLCPFVASKAAPGKSGACARKQRAVMASAVTIRRVGSPRKISRVKSRATVP